MESWEGLHLSRYSTDRIINLWEPEEFQQKQGYNLICGVDEAGRGALAGPVFAAAVILPFKIDLKGINDSKKLSCAMRERLYDEIVNNAVSYSVAKAEPEEIESLNILGATYLAMNRAIKNLTLPPDISLIDGNQNSGIKYNSECLIGGDGKSASIAAASILAKVSRDRYMTELSKQYDKYAFEKHKGYGTKLHYERLREFGLCAIHRKSFLKRLH